MKQSHKTLLLWVLLILMFLAIWHVLQPADKSKAAAFSEFVTDVHKGNVEEVKIKDHEYSYRVRTDGKNTVQKEAVGPMADQALLDSLKPDNKDTPGPKIVFDKEDSSPAWSSTLLALLPTLVGAQYVSDANLEAMKHRHLWIAYAIIWLLIMALVARTAKRQTELKKDLESLSARVEEMEKNRD